jgi:hypothetical protein
MRTHSGVGVTAEASAGAAASSARTASGRGQADGLPDPTAAKQRHRRAAA